MQLPKGFFFVLVCFVLFVCFFVCFLFVCLFFLFVCFFGFFFFWFVFCFFENYYLTVLHCVLIISRRSFYRHLRQCMQCFITDGSFLAMWLTCLISMEQGSSEVLHASRKVKSKAIRQLRGILVLSFDNWKPWIDQ